MCSLVSVLETKSLHTDRVRRVTLRCIVCSNHIDREVLSSGTTTSALFHRGGRVQRVPGGITPAAYCAALDQRGCVRSGGRTRTETLFTSPSQRACNARRRNILCGRRSHPSTGGDCHLHRQTGCSGRSWEAVDRIYRFGNALFSA